MKLVRKAPCRLPQRRWRIAQTYPSKPITLVVPLAIGSTSDILSRTIGASSQAAGQPVIVDDRPGAGGTSALQQVARRRRTGTSSRS